MNKWEKEALEAYEGGETEVLKKIEKQYKRALADIDRNIMILQSDELTQSRIYRIEHQKALRQQVSAILDKLHSDEYATISQFLSGCYTDGFVGAMYNLHGQGIPLLLPIDPKQAVRAVLTDSKLSKPLYEALSVDFKKLKRQISAEISRGISSGMSYNEIARNISWTTNAPMSRARTIVRTEAHRITQASHYDAATQVKKKGVDIVLQWDASLDGDTRDTHRMLDGTVIEVGEYFESNGNKARFPGDFGDPAEDCNCRCVLTERARSALDEEELKTLQERAEFFFPDKPKNFDDFKKKYLKATENLEKSGEKDLKAVENLPKSGTIDSDIDIFNAMTSGRTGMTADYETMLTDRFGKGKQDAQKAFTKFVDEKSVSDHAYNGTAHFDPNTKKVNMNYQKDLNNARGSGSIFFHEHGHYVDFMAAGANNYQYLSTNGSAFGQLLRSDFSDYIASVQKAYGANKRDAYLRVSVDLFGHDHHSISDLFGGLSGGKCKGRYGHPSSYWKSSGALEREAFAHMFEASFDAGKYQLMQKYFPNALKEFERLIKGVI